MSNQEDIIYFDGVCGLCNGFVDFVISVDKQAIFKFSPLQSEFARSTLPREHVENLDSVVARVDGKIFTKSQAVTAIFRKLGGVWGILSVGRFFPASLGDMAYDLVAEYRYKLFGKKETCRLPTPEERKRFLL
ncbi:MAG TPA: DCC1-like thiol-disulfide oxidoreductase family protein [Bacteriovoracaceae bacterium]|nr:DCC1-like thiol-disulfide oxidoreductase family protein [Bacteriovoracaceae bacterium]